MSSICLRHSSNSWPVSPCFLSTTISLYIMSKSKYTLSISCFHSKGSTRASRICLSSLSESSTLLGSKKSTFVSSIFPKMFPSFFTPFPVFLPLWRSPPGEVIECVWISIPFMISFLPWNYSSWWDSSSPLSSSDSSSSYGIVGGTNSKSLR